MLLEWRSVAARGARMTTNARPYFYRRRDASRYLKEFWGLDFAPRTLAKVACVSSDGPSMQYIGRIPYYSRDALDDFAGKKLGSAGRSTSDREGAPMALPSEPQSVRRVSPRMPA